MISVVSGRLLQIYSAFAVTLSAFSYGVGHSWASPAIAKILSNETHFQITNSESSWITSLEMIIIPISAIATIYLLKHYSARTIIYLQTIPLLGCWIAILLAKDIYPLYLSRIFVGLSDGLIFLGLPIYISEVSDPTIRGALMCLIPSMVAGGNIFAFYLGYYLSIRDFALLAMLIPVINFVLLLPVPQSPYFLIYNSRLDEGKDALIKLRSKGANIDTEFDTIKKSLEEQKLSPGSYREFFFNPKIRRIWYIVGSITFIQQISGVQTIGSYLHIIVDKTEIQLSTENTTAIFGIISLVTSMLMMFFIDSQGRRKLLIVSCAGTSLCLLILGLFFFEQQILPAWIAIAALYGSVISYHIGLADIAIIISGELYPTSIKNYGAGFGCCIYGIIGFVTNKLFQIISDWIGVQYIFWLFSGCTFIGLLYCYFCVPETTNKSLEVIQIMLGEIKKPQKEVKA